MNTATTDGHPRPNARRRTEHIGDSGHTLSVRPVRRARIRQWLVTATRWARLASGLVAGHLCAHRNNGHSELSRCLRAGPRRLRESPEIAES